MLTLGYMECLPSISDFPEASVPSYAAHHTTLLEKRGQPMEQPIGKPFFSKCEAHKRLVQYWVVGVWYGMVE